MKQIVYIISFFSFLSLHAQTTISGKVTDKKGIPIEGANVYLEGTYDGTSTNEKGKSTIGSKPGTPLNSDIK